MKRLAWILLVFPILGSCAGPEPKDLPAVPRSVEKVPPPPAPKPPEPPPEPQWARLGHPFDESGVSLFELKLPPEEWTSLVQQSGEERWHRCTLFWGGKELRDVGIAPSGQITRIPGNPKPSIRISFKKFVPGRHFHKLSGFKLDSMSADPSMLRERLAYGCYRAAGLPAPRESHAWVKVNGQDLGLYAVEERIGRQFLKDHFGGPVTTQLYYWTGYEDDLPWKGSNALEYVPNPLKPRIRSLPFAGKDMAALMDSIANKTYDEAAKAFDVDVLLRQLAVEILTGETDGIVGVPTAGETRTNWMSNFFLYKDPKTQKYRLLVWDRDQSFWRPLGTSITQGLDAHLITRKLILDRPENLDRLRGILRELLEGPLAPERLQARLDEIRTQIKDAAHRDVLKKATTNANYEAEVNELRSYVRANADSVRKQIQ